MRSEFISEENKDGSYSVYQTGLPTINAQTGSFEYARFTELDLSGYYDGGMKPAKERAEQLAELLNGA